MHTNAIEHKILRHRKSKNSQTPVIGYRSWQESRHRANKLDYPLDSMSQLAAVQPARPELCLSGPNLKYIKALFKLMF